jgi:PqqD family protein of HPr-rel-A system
MAVTENREIIRNNERVLLFFPNLRTCFSGVTISFRCWRFWGDEAVIYNCNSGDTHLLNRIAADTLETLQNTPASTEELTRMLALRFGIDADREFLKQMDELLLNFYEQGLIKPLNEI